MRIAIIGGSGKMGRWLAEFLKKDGHEVVIAGRNEKKLLEAQQQLGVEVAGVEAAVKSADTILLSVSMDSFEGVVEQVCPYTRAGQVIADITSVKVAPVEIMHRYIKNGTVLGAHPMFGPGARDITNQNIILTPTNDVETALAQKTVRYLEARGARATVMTPQEHDEMMAVILGLSHFIAVVSADTLLNYDLKRMEAVGGSTYKVLLTLAESVISSEEPEFFASLQTSLPNMAEIEKLFQENTKTWADLVKNRDRQKLIERMNALKDRLAKVNPDYGKAYENIYKIVEGLNL